MYNIDEQYRCTIIRGKSQKEMENLLPTYANIVEKICPIESKEFGKQFNKELAKVMRLDLEKDKKTIDNHRTEIVIKLFGMVFKDSEDIIYMSERTQKYIADNDQPAFFKDICYKMQFPNGMDKIQTLKDRIENKIGINQIVFILHLLKAFNNIGENVSKDELGYYVLNSKEVLQGKIKPTEVMDTIIEQRKKNDKRKVFVEGKESSYYLQHINEQINLIVLANLVRIDKNYIYLNTAESKTINFFLEKDWKNIGFNIYKYNLKEDEAQKMLYFDWQVYYSKLSTKNDTIFNTEVSSLQIDIGNILNIKQIKPTVGKIALGDDGEGFVYEYEKNRVSKYNHRFVGKVIHLGKTRGLGYDIQSVIAEKGDREEFVKYIEVKSTKRVTEPNLEEEDFLDTINLTRNEWVAAEQHKEYYSIYRVYFTAKKTIVYVIENPASKKNEGKIYVVPTNYRLDFTKTAIDKIIEK